MKTILIDFDGVVNSYRSGYHDKRLPDDPFPNAFEALSEYLKYFEVYIFSTRCTTEYNIKMIIDWFNEKGFTETDKLKFTSQKQPSILLIDDRCLQFKGVFPTVEEINNFKPWRIK